ncbi:hypothetical protein K501DRAFT_262099 [Backusella circina FSU 941]|nr:hypothetical protein K501DRAFT_262099 [Backusella circina FSU 941]
MPSAFPLLSCKSTTELSELVAHMVPKIWMGSPFATIDRHTAFKLFCQKLLKATQISTTCVLLALFYIYRLRATYPSIRGSMGSEVRLFTTALVLANKFLDDNTFTNKTWSDVSNIAVKELNIMELEFLSALNYQIYISHTHFFQWTTQCQHWTSQLFHTNLSSYHRSSKISSRTAINKSHKTSIKRAADSMSPETPIYSTHNHIGYYNNLNGNKRIHLMTATPEQTRWKPILSWSSSNIQTSASVATVAAATAMNYSTFIPRVRCLEIE